MSEKRVCFSDTLMDALHTQVLDRIRQADPGRVFTPKDFLDLASRDVTDQSLSRLVRSGTLRRLGRGLYTLPRRNESLGVEIPPDLDEVAEAIARQTASRIVPSGALAANRLGLSTQVPAKPLYLTDGRTRQVRVGKYLLQMKHVVPKELPVGSRKSALVFQALRYLGKDAVDDHVLSKLRAALSPEDRRQLVNDAKYATDWICQIARTIASPREPARHG